MGILFCSLWKVFFYTVIIKQPFSYLETFCNNFFVLSIMRKRSCFLFWLLYLNWLLNHKRKLRFLFAFFLLNLKSGIISFIEFALEIIIFLRLIFDFSIVIILYFHKTFLILYSQFMCLGLS